MAADYVLGVADTYDSIEKKSLAYPQYGQTYSAF
jgi:hypothetical protein